MVLVLGYVLKTQIANFENISPHLSLINCILSKYNIIIPYADLKEAINSMVVAVDGGFTCIACKQKFNFICNARTHIESKHMNTGGFLCNICGFISKTRDSLRKHTKSQHPYNGQRAKSVNQLVQF